MRTPTLISIFLAAAATTCAHAGSVVIQAGGALTLQAGDLSASVFGGSDSAWTAASLASAHATLRRSGVQTDGKVTIAAANTSQGLSLLVLVDEALSSPQSTSAYGNLGMFSSAWGAGLSHITDASKAAKIQSVTNGTLAADVTYKWNSNGAGEGFAWTNLDVGDAFSFRFVNTNLNLGLDQASTFQFVSWNGSSWEVVRSAQNSFDGRQQFGFSGEVIQTVVVPTPSAIALAFGPLMLLGCGRQRRVTGR
jgi:hypothetical protein